MSLLFSFERKEIIIITEKKLFHLGKEETRTPIVSLMVGSSVLNILCILFRFRAGSSFGRLNSRTKDLHADARMTAGVY